MDFVVIGPGISLDKSTQELVLQFALKVKKPILIDGDGLNAFNKQADRLSSRKFPTILTPHPGEFSRLIDKPIGEITANRMEILQEFSEQSNSVVVLKGARTLIAHPDGRIFINLSGNSGLGTAGSGDVLCGIIASMHQYKWESIEAVRSAVFLHGLSGDLAVQDISKDGMIAGDLLNTLASAIKYYRNNYKEIMKDNYGKIKLV